LKRDLDLAREILAEIEEHSYDPNHFFEVEIAGYSSEEVAYHVMLLAEAGYIEASSLALSDTTIWKAQRLTWEGHEFLEVAKDDTRWSRAKVVMKEKGGGMAFEVLKQLLIEMMKGTIGLGPH
jgi:hypothetical protein